MSLILANTIILLLYDPMDASNPFNLIISQTELFFLVCFTLEAFLKCVALGIYFEDVYCTSTYFKSNWNRFDFLLLLLGWIQFGLKNFGSQTPITSIFRLIRILRPIQRIHSSMNWVSMGLFRSLNSILSASVLYFVFQTIFAISGLIYFQGKLLQRCEDNDASLCSLDPYAFGTTCQENASCVLVVENPNFNVTSFDDIFHVFVILFQSITMEGWSDIMYDISDTSGTGSQVYFIILVVFGGYFMLHILVALLAVNISVQRQLFTQKEIDKKLESEGVRLRDDSVEEAAKHARYRQFLKRNKLRMVDAMKLRLALSYERMQEHAIISQKEYLDILDTFGVEVFVQFKQAVLPILDPLELLACKKRSRARRRSRRLTPPVISQRVLAEELGNLNPQTKRDFFPWLQQCFRFRNRIQNAGPQPRPDSHVIRRFCFHIASSMWFSFYLMNAVIVLNIVALAMVHYNQPVWLFTFQYYCDLVFFSCFLLEMVVKHVGFGPLYYWTNYGLIFDGTITLLGLIQFSPLVSASLVSPLRALRLLRMFPFLLKLPSMRRIFRAFLRALTTALPFLLIMCLFILLFAILGLHLFGGIMPHGAIDCSSSYPYFPQCPPRTNFDTFSNSLLTTFMLLVLENWNEIMYDVVAASSLWSFLYFFALMCLGNFILLNIFLGVLIDSFMLVREEERNEALAQKSKTSVVQDGNDAEEVEGNNDTSVRAARSILNKRKAARGIDVETNQELATEALREFVLVESQRREILQTAHTFERHASYFKTSCRMRADKWPRYPLGVLVVSLTFQRFMILTILASCVLMCIPDLNPIVSVVFCALFALEFVLKGFAFGLPTYFASKWNVLDFLLLVLQIASLIVFSELGPESVVGKVFFATRAFSSLRIVRYVEGLKITLHSLATSVYPVLELCFVIACFYIGWGVLGTLLFQGLLFACVEPNSFTRIPQDDICVPNALYNVVCPVNATMCRVENWVNPTYGEAGAVFSMDNFGEAVLLLFEMTTLENWVTPTFAAMDIAGMGHNAIREFSYSASLFFCLVVIFFNLFLMQVFVAVLVDEFRESARMAEAKSFLTPRQAEWVRMKRKVWDLPFRSKKVYVYASSAWRTKMHTCVTSRVFKTGEFLVIVFNTIVLMSIHYLASPSYWYFFRTVDFVVGGIYWMGLVGKFVAFGVGDFFRHKVNWLHLLVCVTTTVGWAVPDFFFAAQVIDSFQVFHLVVAFHSTKKLLGVLMLSAPLMGNIIGLLFLILYIYSLVGMAVFSNVGPAPDLAFVNNYANFQHFGNAVVTLFRMSTGESWNGLMRDFALAGSAFAYPFFISFVILVQFLFMNLIVAVVMFDLEEEMENREKTSRLTLKDLVEYSTVWSDLRYELEKSQLMKIIPQEHLSAAADKSSSWNQIFYDFYRGLVLESDFYSEQMYLPAQELPNLLNRMGPPLGLKSALFSRGDRMRVISMLKIPVDDRGMIHFHCTLSVLLDRVILSNGIEETFHNRPVVDTPAEQFHELQSLMRLNVSKRTLEYEETVLAKMTTTRTDGVSQLVALDLVQKCTERFVNKKRRRVSFRAAGEDDSRTIFPRFNELVLY